MSTRLSSQSLTFNEANYFPDQNWANKIDHSQYRVGMIIK